MIPKKNETAVHDVRGKLVAESARLMLRENRIINLTINHGELNYFSNHKNRCLDCYRCVQKGRLQNDIKTVTEAFALKGQKAATMIPLSRVRIHEIVQIKMHDGFCFGREIVYSTVRRKLKREGKKL